MRARKEWQMKKASLSALFSFAVLFLLFLFFPASSVAKMKCPTTNFPDVGRCEADDSSFAPVWGNSPWATTDWFAPTKKQIDGVKKAIKRETGLCTKSYDGAQKMRGGSPSKCLKIVHNIVYGRQLLTAIFPPRYDPAAAPSTYRLVLSPNFLGSSNNFVMYGLWSEGKPWMALNLARLAGAGAIVVVTNVGGAYAFPTPRFYEEIRYLLDDLRVWWAVDTSAILTFGASRGGITSLLLAQQFWGNGGGHLVTDVFAAAPVGLWPGTQLAKAPIPNYYGIGDVINLFGGDEDAFRSHEKRFDALEGITGTRDPAAADAAGIHANAERLRGVNLHLAIGTHDPYMPLWHMTEFERELARLEVPAQVGYVLGGGHGDAMPIVAEAAIACVQSGSRPCAPPRNKRTLYGDDIVVHEEHDAPLGFVVVSTPYRLEPGAEGMFDITGPPGLVYAIAADGLFQRQDVIPQSGYESIPFRAPDASFVWHVDFLPRTGEFVGSDFLSTGVGPIVSVWDYSPPHAGMGNAAFGAAVLVE
jgi:hypothetical protein